MPGGRYWDRTSGLFRVRETRSRCAKRPWQSSLTEWRIIASMNFASFSCALPEVSLEYRPARGSGSVGRAQPCQGWGRGFEPRLPLHAKSRAGFPVGSFTQMATWPSGKAGACKALTTGSNPVLASIFADMAQLVEHHLAKVGVAGSSPVVRSSFYCAVLTNGAFSYEAT